MYNDRRRQSAAVRYGPHHENTLNNILLRARNMESTLNNLKKEAEYITQRSWVIKKSNLGGRGLFASKFIKKGSLIFTNKPLVIGPRADCAAKTYCSICYVISEFCYPCDKCSLFICSKECGISQEHAKECAFILDYWKPKTPCDKKSKVLNQMLIYLRFFLLNEEQKQLVSFLQKSNNYSDFEELKALCSQYEIPKYQVQFIRTINAMIKLNSFRISESSCKKTIPLRGIFHLSSFLNHSCVPNTRNVFKNDYTMCVFASKDIEIGEEILTCYTGILWCTPVRRCHLKKTKNFWCKCRRCADPTEMNTKLSALKCFNKECVGFLIPLVPLNPETEWRCDNCKTIATPHHVSTVHSVLGSLVGILDLDDKFRLETVILEKISNFIPYSNHIFTDLRLRLALKIGFTEGLKLNGILKFNNANNTYCLCNLYHNAICIILLTMMSNKNLYNNFFVIIIYIGFAYAQII
ncbi:SET domain-containing protein SmydA-8-like [Galleria mellonella]|uniref:SET domain-containing protein SmydA-8-like n=1 Tax=Galleria mellonella TaxID=7137 RepID=A0ABM3N4M0_GALME|nr:SET domain-containing protein SmydA-8-like [Galleria mellonella]